MEAEFSDGPNLSEKTKDLILSIMKKINEIIDMVAEPIDPKVLPLLEVSLDILDEQIVGDKIYAWEIASEILDILGEDEPPTVDDLNSWLNGD